MDIQAEKDNILIRIAFNGSAYHGFQVQKNAVSICAVLQDAMKAVLGSRPDVKGCSRTDAGVHAKAYAASFFAKLPFPIEKLPLSINSFLPQDIRVYHAQYVDKNFHARYSALGKEYEYVILNSNIDDVFLAGQYYRVHGKLDEFAMQQAAETLIGRHDFAAFMAAGSDVKDTVRTINYLRCEKKDRWVIITIAADGFLYNMVRIIAGTLLAVGKGRIMPGQINEILESKNRKNSGETLPAKGLFLTKVFY